MILHYLLFLQTKQKYQFVFFEEKSDTIAKEKLVAHEKVTPSEEVDKGTSIFTYIKSQWSLSVENIWLTLRVGLQDQQVCLILIMSG